MKAPVQPYVYNSCLTAWWTKEELNAAAFPFPEEDDIIIVVETQTYYY